MSVCYSRRRAPDNTVLLTPFIEDSSVDCRALSQSGLFHRLTALSWLRINFFVHKKVHELVVEVGNQARKTGPIHRSVFDGT